MVGLDARGFLLGPIIALRLGAAFAPVRKPGKLPGTTVTATFEKEYGSVCILLQAEPAMTERYQGFIRDASRLNQARTDSYRS